MKYVGLTDDPVRRRQEHGNPLDWEQKTFNEETKARDWEKLMLTMPNYQGGTGGDGWHYGYIYTITSYTKQ